MINSHALYRLSYGGMYPKQVYAQIAQICYGVGVFLSSRAVTSQVFSALMSLTSVFGMGTGGPSSLSMPTINAVQSAQRLTGSTLTDNQTYCQ